MIEKIENYLEQVVERVTSKLDDAIQYKALMEGLSVLEKVSVIKRNLDLKTEEEDFEDEETMAMSDQELAKDLSGKS